MKTAGLALAATLPFAAAAQTIAPTYLQAIPGQTIQFTAPAGATWQVNNATGGTTATGTISPSGLYTAPTTLPPLGAVTVTAITSTGSATATITLLPQQPAGKTYYVATNGRDTNPGTITQPFATFQHAADIAQPGDTVLARGGTYNQLTTIKTHATAANPITFASYPGEVATIDGTGLPIPGGMAGLITLTNASGIIIEGLELRNYTTSKLSQVPLGLYIQGAGDFIQIVNTHIHNITTTAKTNPKQCGSNAFGLAAYGTQAPQAITNLVVSGNEVDHLHTGCSESLTINGNVDGYAVVSNIVHDNDNIGIDGIGYEHTSPDPAYDRARNGEVRGNLVYNITSYGNPDYGKQYAADGIYIDGGTAITIEQNIVHHTDLAIELASEHKGKLTDHVIARNNLLYLNNSNGISIGGYGPGRGGTDSCAILNNTLYGNDTKNTGSGEFQIQYHATNNTFANNIVYAGPQALLVHAFTRNATPPAALDHNLYFAAGSPPIFVYNGHRYTSLAAYQAATGQDQHSTYTDPLFQNAAQSNFDIAPNSPARNAGTVLPQVGATDLPGNPRVNANQISIGAYQN